MYSKKEKYWGDNMEVMICYQELLSLINNSELANQLRQAFSIISEDDELVSLINKYHNTKDDDIRNEIYNNDKFIKYKKLENEVNLLVLRFNSIFKELRNEDN